MPLVEGATERDAVVVGAGPNGLAAAITLARAGLDVELIEATSTLGGGSRSEELTLPGVFHDVCSSVHPLARSSAFFREVEPLEGLEWIEPEVPLAHPLDGGVAGALLNSLDATAARFGRDAGAYRRLIEPIVRRWDDITTELLNTPLRFPRHPLSLARFGLPALVPAATLGFRSFSSEPPKALFAGVSAHSILPLRTPGTSAFGLLLTAAAHVIGWPIPRGGSQRIADGLAERFRALGGTIRLDHHVRSLDELPRARAILLDVTPLQLAAIARKELPERYRRALERYRYGEGVFKLDYALDGPVPWAAEECRRAVTVHVGGRFDEVTAAEAEVGRGQHPDRPFVICVQPTVVDPTRAPAGTHILWAYCHVPNGSLVDMTEAIERQIERFAPGFRDRILAKSAMNTADIHAHNPSVIGGDISGGAHTLSQLFTRPTVRPEPWRTPVAGLYLSSASTPPGAGVHGLCGWHAAHIALRDRFPDAMPTPA